MNLKIKLVADSTYGSEVDVQTIRDPKVVAEVVALIALRASEEAEDEENLQRATAYTEMAERMAAAAERAKAAGVDVDSVEFGEDVA